MTEPHSPLIQALHRLHGQAGFPSSRRIGYRSGGVLSHTSINNILTGATFPRWSSIEAFVRALGGNPADYRALWEQGQEARNQDRPRRIGKLVKEGLVIRPGDTVVFTVDPNIEDDELATLYEDLAKLVPENVKVAVFTDVKVSVIRGEVAA